MFVFIKIRDELINLSGINRIKLSGKSIEVWLSNSTVPEVYTYSSDIESYEVYEEIVSNMHELDLLA